MDWKPILTAALTVGGMGLIFGALLAIVSRIFHVERTAAAAATPAATLTRRRLFPATRR